MERITNLINQNIDVITFFEQKDLDTKSEEVNVFVGGQIDSEYLSFLREFGCIMIGSEFIYGVGDKHASTIFVTSGYMSEESGKQLPPGHLVVNEDGSGSCDVICCVSGPRYGTVCYWNPFDAGNTAEDMEEVAPTFADYLKQQIAFAREDM